MGLAGSVTGRHESLFGYPMSSVALVTLTVQTALSALVIHASRTTAQHGPVAYSPAAAILVAELVRVSICLSVALYESSIKLPKTAATGLFRDVLRQVLTAEFWAILPPALFFTAQTFLQFFALSHVDPCTYLAASQFRAVIFTAVATALSRTPIPIRRALWLLMLTIGVIVTVVPQGPEPLKQLREGSQTGYWHPRTLDELTRLGSKTAARLSGRSATYQGIVEDDNLIPSTQSAGFGLMATLASCMFSGLAGSIVDVLLRETCTEQGFFSGRQLSGSWIRNVQASIVAIVVSAAALVLIDGEQVSQSGFFGGFNVATWFAVLLYAGGGAAVAWAIPHGSPSTPPFAAIGSIGIAFVFCVIFDDLDSPITYLIGLTMIVGSLWSLGQQAGRLRLPAAGSGASERSGVAIYQLDVPDPESQIRPRSRSPAKRGLPPNGQSRPTTPISHKLRSSLGL